MSIDLDAMCRDLDRWCAANPEEAETADLDGCERPSLLRRLRSRLALWIKVR